MPPDPSFLLPFFLKITTSTLYLFLSALLLLKALLPIRVFFPFIHAVYSYPCMDLLVLDLLLNTRALLLPGIRSPPNLQGGDVSERK